MAAPTNPNNTTPFFGCKISLISKSEIRYEGILYTIDPKESTIALAKVRSFGSEDRPVERPVPPRDDVFEFIIFRASDIKDLIVDDPPPTPALTDPAIIQAHSTSTSFPSSFPQASINAAAPAPVAPVGPSAPQQTPIQQLQAKGSGGATGGVSVPKQNETHTDSSKPKNATSSNAPPNYSRAAGGGGGSVSQQQTRQPNQRQNLQFNKQQQNKPSGEQSQQSSQAPNRSNNQQPQQNAQNQNGYVRRNQQNQSHGPSQQNRVIGETQNPNYHARNGMHRSMQQQNQGGFSSQHRFTPRQGQGQQQQPQQHQFSGGFRRGGGPGGISGGPRNFISRPMNQHNGPKFPPLPDGDFDFEKAQADFKILEEKLHALKLNGSLGEVAEGPSADTTDVVVPGIPASAISVAALEQEEQELPKEACYNKQKSFFDQISCEALEREKGSHRVDWKQERKMNRETFGAVSARRPTFFRTNNRGGGFGGGYHQHRGGYYNQRGGSGGYYQNRNYQNRQPRSQNAPGAGGSNNVSSTTSTRTPAKSTPNGVGASPSSSAAPIAIATKN